MRSRLEFILSAVERIDLTVYDENLQFEFFQKEKVSKTRFWFAKMISRYSFLTYSSKKHSK